MRRILLKFRDDCRPTEERRQSDLVINSEIPNAFQKFEIQICAI